MYFFYRFLIFGLFDFLVLGSKLWDHVIQMKMIDLSVDYNGRFLHVWKEDQGNFERYFATPLCELMNSLANCTLDEYSKDIEYTVPLRLKIWSQTAVEAIQSAFSQKGINISAENIYPIPMQMFRLGSSKRLNFEIDTQWRYNQHQSKEIFFELKTRDKNLCDRIAKDAKDDPKNFLEKTRLYLEFSMLGPKQIFIDVNVTRETLVKSEFFNKINKCHKNQGILYLTPYDLNKLSNEVLNVSLAQDDLESLTIPVHDRQNIVKVLSEIIEDQQVPATNLSKEEWSSLFLHDQNNMNWPRQKFGPNRLILHRINTTCLLSREKFFHKRIVSTVIPATIKIEIAPEILKNDLTSNYRKIENPKPEIDPLPINITEKLSSYENFLNRTLYDFQEKISFLRSTQLEIQNDTDLILTYLTNIQRYVINNSNGVEMLKFTTNKIWNRVEERATKSFRDFCKSGDPEWRNIRMTDVEWMLVKNYSGFSCENHFLGNSSMLLPLI